ncbi:hypothetical protein KFL_005340060 [Klebsormidium nitens]|uniref:Fe2OG dioxygenase domain-containing protein n=1 Tax=Klebsormidium nitens TaxID=105231 RepID=A0A1Y1IK67_KLENI|nr:hypothetical protein KFL_005340060 [Klebsormidium nitens]|eukprot:GAQ89541.1 hypothetical protein KFL_005340060 [Klebsormidium nitens]
MEPLSLVQNFQKLQTALRKIVKDGLRLGSIETEGTFYGKRYKSTTYGQKERLLANTVKELYGSFAEKNVFCCGGLVKLPEHDLKSVIVKLVDGPPQSSTLPSSATETGQSGPNTTLAESITNLILKNVIEKSSIAGFGDLKEGANVVDYSVRKAWESFFHLDFDYSYKPSSRTYIPGLSRGYLVRLGLGSQGRLDHLEWRATIEAVSTKALKTKRSVEDPEYYTATFTAKVTKDDRSLKTTVTAGKVEEPQEAYAHVDLYDKNALQLSYECECGERAAKSALTWCDHAVATLVALVDPLANKKRPDFEYNKALFLQPIMKHIQERMAHGARISLLPYKINVYGEGGFFKRHVDSPRDVKNMIGTLVVCLPSEHEGGELVVSHGGVDHVFDFAPRSGDRERVQWAAMYGDCVHEVKEVKRGFRATLTFSIIQEEEPKEEESPYWICRSDPEVPRVRDNLSDIGYKINADVGHYDLPKMEDEVSSGPWNKPEAERKAQSIVEALRALDPAPDYVTILLSHDYTQANLLRPEILKGSDWVLHQAVAGAFPVKMLTVVTRDHWNLPDESNEDFHEGQGAAKYSCYAFTKEDLAWLVGEGPKPEYKWAASAAAGKTLLVAPTAAQKAKLEERESGYSGNEYEEGGETLSVYFEAALVIEIAKKV